MPSASTAAPLRSTLPPSGTQTASRVRQSGSVRTGDAGRSTQAGRFPRTSTVAPCVTEAQVFQHPLLEEALPSSAPASLRTLRASLTVRAERACRACPIWADCLYGAVVEHDVAGFAAGTTAAQRSRIRRLLDIEVEPEDLDSLAGALGGGHRRVDHDEVVRMRNAHPQESLEAVARRLGCSLSTVKRHLRKERASGSERVPAPPRPKLGAVLRAAAEVTGAAANRTRAA